MARKKGTVTRAGKSKFSYFLQLDGDDFYFNTKFEPKCGEGDVVGIEYNKQNDQRGQVSKITVIDDNSGGYQKSNSERGSGGGGKSSGGGNDNRQDSICWQSSRKDALVLTGILTSNDLVKIPKGDKGRVVIEALIDEITVGYFKDALDPRSSKALKDMQEIEDDSKEDKDDDDWDDDDSWD